MRSPKCLFLYFIIVVFRFGGGSSWFGTMATAAAANVSTVATVFGCCRRSLIIHVNIYFDFRCYFFIYLCCGWFCFCFFHSLPHNQDICERERMSNGCWVVVVVECIFYLVTPHTHTHSPIDVLINIHLKCLISIWVVIWIRARPDAISLADDELSIAMYVLTNWIAIHCVSHIVFIYMAYICHKFFVSFVCLRQR